MSVGVVTPANAGPKTSPAPAVKVRVVVPSAQGITPVTKHCGRYAQWNAILNDHDARLRFRIWYYIDGNHEWQYCTKVYKMKPKHNKTLIQLRAFGYYGWTPTKKTRGASAWLRHSTPEHWYSFVRVKYGKITYGDITLLSR